MAERARARKGKGKKEKGGNGVGHNSASSLSDEVRRRWWDKIEQLAKAVERAKEPYDSAKGKLQQAYKAADEDGIDVDALRATRKALKFDRTRFTSTYRETGAFLRMLDHPLGTQFNLFADPEWPEPVNANLHGYTIGKAGGSIDENPHSPGTDSFAQFRTGYELGQEELRESIRAS